MFFKVHMGFLGSVSNKYHFSVCFIAKSISRQDCVTMEGKNIEISLPNICEQVIWTFFKWISSHYGTVGTFGKCKTCSEDIFLEKEKKNLHEHLKLHPVKWNLYLTKLAHAIKPDLPSSSEIDALKLATLRF